MNLLAHAYLSPRVPGVLVGNVVADWVKGRARLGLPAEVQAGMRLHGRIDAFTDTYREVLLCGELLADRWGRYAAVLVDILFDHVLAAGWRRHSDVPLEQFAGEVYGALGAYRGALPARCNEAIAYMTADDWFTSYASLDGIRVTLSRLSRRLRHEVELAPAVDDFVRHREAFERAFAVFFPELCAHAGAVEMAKV